MTFPTPAGHAGSPDSSDAHDRAERKGGGRPKTQGVRNWYRRKLIWRTRSSFTARILDPIANRLGQPMVIRPYTLTCMKTRKR